jgi:hypothetical protein
MTHIDDEYAQAGIEDPRVLITTSRDPSSKLQQFAKVRSRWRILAHVARVCVSQSGGAETLTSFLHPFATSCHRLDAPRNRQPPHKTNTGTAPLHSQFDPHQPR